MIPRLPESKIGGVVRNRQAFMGMIPISELGPELIKVSDEGYNVLVGSTAKKPIIFRDYSDHPNVLNKALNSTAAGPYQILYKFWPHYKALLKLPDFGPISQDLYCLQQLKERRALDDIDAGRIREAIAKTNNIWASFTGSPYGQHTHPIDYLVSAFETSGGTVA